MSDTTMRDTRQIDLGGVKIGGGAPVSIQSMTNRPSDDATGTLEQIGRLAAAGCDIVRVAVPNRACLPAIRRICEESPLPVVGDIHFDHQLALAALEAGCAAIRVNPGNMLNVSAVREVARRAAELGRVVRIGVNGGSLSAAALERHGRGVEALVESALEYVRVFEEEGCTALKVSLKSSDVRVSVEACRRFAARSDLPLHLGVTEAGPVSCGVIKSAIGIGALLLDGIGETIRVSLTADPVEEVRAAKRILAACGLREQRPEIISCPTCGRTRIALLPLVSRVERAIEELQERGVRFGARRIAIMGCEVNGPGEAKGADFGIAGGLGKGILFRHGEKVRDVPEDRLFETLMEELMATAHT